MEDVEQTGRKISKKRQAQIVLDREIVVKISEEQMAEKKKLEELEVASFMEAKRLDRMEEDPLYTVQPTVLREKTPEFSYVPTEEDIEFLIANNAEIKKKAIDLVADASLTEEQRTAQLKDFIQMKNNQALEDVISTVKKGQKKSRQPTKRQILSYMKTYCCHVGGWKMHQFKGMSDDQVEKAYYRTQKQDKDFIAMGSEEEARRFPRLKRKAKVSDSQTVKKTKVDEDQTMSTEKEIPTDKFTEDQLTGMIAIEERDFYPEPLQVRHPIID